MREGKDVTSVVQTIKRSSPSLLRARLGTKLYQVVSTHGPSGTKWGSSRDQVRTLTRRLEASLKTVVVATRIGLGRKRLNGGAA